MKKLQVIFLAIVALIIGYFLSSVLFFGLNHSFKKLPKLWYAGLTFDMLINGWTKAYLAYFLGNLISFSLVFLLPFLPKKESLHGDARFANSSDVKKMDLYGDGIIIGKYQNRLLRFGGQQFVSLGAPTRSGKGVGIVIPNLLDWKESAVVQDIKQECFDFTSGYREKILGQEVFLFDPFNRRTHRYNPLAYIDMNSDNADGQLTDFANILYPMTGNDTADFFNQLAQNLFIGICYMVHNLLNTKGGVVLLQKLGVEIDFTLYGILQMSEGFKGDIDIDGSYKISFKAFEDTFNTLAELGLIGKKAQMRCQSYFKIDSENTKSGVMSSFNAPLMMFRNDNMRLATSANDFDFRDLRRKKMTIYVGITPDQLANAKLILNIFWQQLILVNTKELPQANPELKHKVLLVMDEFTAPGRLAIYLKSISFIAGYWLRSLMIYQSGSQLEANPPEGYGRDGAKTLLTNHACQIFYTPREQEDAEKISKILGTKTIKNRSRNLGQGGGGSESDTSRALMLPQELREMPFENELITIDNGKPIMAKKAFYYSDRYFMDKFKEVSPSLRAIDGKEYEALQYEEVIDKKSKKSHKRVKIKQNGKIPSRDQLEKAIQSGETNIEVPIQNMANIKSYFAELFDTKGERFKSLPEIVFEPDETQQEYEKKLRLQREREVEAKKYIEEQQKKQEAIVAKQTSEVNSSVENIQTDPPAAATNSEIYDDDEEMKINSQAPNYDDINQDFSE